MVTVLIMATLVGSEHWVAISRPPSYAQIVVLKKIRSVSDKCRREIDALDNQGALTFYEAKRICRRNIAHRDEADRRWAQISAGPQVNCDITDGEHVVLKALGKDAVFVPCIDGWYRFHNRDQKLHRMLAAGAAGTDAGLYWILDHQEGVWGVPAAIITDIQSRLDKLAQTTTSPVTQRSQEGDGALPGHPSNDMPS